MKRPKCTCKETVSKNTVYKTLDPKCSLHNGKRRRYYQPAVEEEEHGEDRLTYNPFSNYRR